ncbi:MAG: GNAT family N-acetyltransferase [Myxococcota bacterium]
MSALRVIATRDPADLPRCHAVRREVFVQEQGVTDREEIDGRDGDATHFLALRGDTVVGTARLRVTEDGVAKAERVAVRAPERRKGTGAALMRALQEEARRAGHGSVVLGAQLSAVPFYARLGYEVFGEPFEDARIPHRWMRLELPSP